jgi:hypothetical protein
MAALTKDRNIFYREGIELEFSVAANTRIFAGSLVCVNSDGYVVPAADSSNLIFAGVAFEQVDNSTGANGDKTIRVRRSGVFEFNALSIAQTMVGTAMYAADDQTFDDASGLSNDVRVGILTK